MRMKIKNMENITVIFLVVALLFGVISGTVIKSNAVTTVKWEGDIDTTWYDGNSGSTTFEIDTAEELAGLAKLVNEGTTFSGKTVVLTNDIDLDNIEWTPIGTLSNWYNVKTFEGTFDGGNYNISNLYIKNSSSWGQGLFGCIADGTIKNVNVTGEIYGSVCTAGIVAYLVASEADVTVDNCTFIGSVSGSEMVGGIVGYAIETNLSDDDFGGMNEDSSYAYNIVITNCTNYGTVAGTSARVGGIVGMVGNCSTSVVESCSNYGDVSSTSAYVGGVIGMIYNNCTVKNCSNNATVKGSQHVGGVIGELNGTTNTESCVIDCTNTASVIATSTGNSYVGGIIGRIYTNSSSTTLEISGCFNTGDITGNGAEVGGIAGSIANGVVTLSDCFSEGDVVGVSSLGGIVGNATESNPDIKIEDCYYKINNNFDTSSKTDGVGLEEYEYEEKRTVYLDSLKELPSIEVTIEGWVFGATVNEPSYKTTSDGTDVSYIYYRDEDCLIEVEDITSAEGGTYYVKAVIESTDNYLSATSDACTFVIEEKVEQEMTTTGSVDISVDDETKEQLLNELFTDSDVSKNLEMKVSVQVDITDSDAVSAEIQALFDGYLSNYNSTLNSQGLIARQTMIMEISVIRTFGDDVSEVTSLTTPITITISIPEEYQSMDATFFILRNHNGVITLLEDEDNDPTTITFTTDCFSEYTLNCITADDSISDIVGQDTELPEVSTGDVNGVQFLMILLTSSMLGFLVSKKKKVL
ncbi:autotransporter outer membrane beta-barrel domain-containing protein [Tannockella kyphosi]|uniref:hypothetical protein n=1 Tax=Tannockella kyphosi TaxID=2899121 RepID=UPI002012D029|nr:hypothetical protein [Tannockella kyphosi]